MRNQRTFFRYRARRTLRILPLILLGLTLLVPAKAAERPLSPERLAQAGGKDSDRINLLLIGQDRREGETASRSDSIVLCTIQKDALRMTMTSFLRDLYVPIPGHGSNRINAAYAFGGTELLQQTLSENFGIRIDGCFEVDFSQFSRLVDLRGGVAIDLRQDEAQLINADIPGSTLQEGKQLLNGEQALAYARIRKLDADGDFSRTDRQRKIISAFFDSCKDLRLPEILELVEQAIPMVSTDMKKAKVLSLTLELFPLLPEMEIISQKIPVEGTFTDQTIDGMAVLEADMDANRKYLEESLMQ